MNIPETTVHQLIDNLTRSNRSFALYRLPWTDEPILILQKEGNPEIVETLAGLNGKEGFIMAPFQTSGPHPIVIIRPDKTAHGWDEIAGVMKDETGLQTSSVPALPNVPEAADEKQKYTETFDLFITPLKKGEFRKLVLSRQSPHSLAPGFSPLNAFVKACNSYPRMMISLCHTPVSGTWTGSTPEIILSGSGTEWHTVALAGTMQMDGENMPTEWDRKNKEDCQEIRLQAERERALYSTRGTVGPSENGFSLHAERHAPSGRHPSGTASHSCRMRSSKRRSVPLYPKLGRI